VLVRRLHRAVHCEFTHGANEHLQPNAHVPDRHLCEVKDDEEALFKACLVQKPKAIWKVRRKIIAYCNKVCSLDTVSKHATL
jgi:hypothetical protein